MNLTRVLNSAEAIRVTAPAKKAASRRKSDRNPAPKKTDNKKDTESNFVNYEVVSELENVATGMQFGQLMHCDAVNAAKTLRHLLAPLKSRCQLKAAAVAITEEYRILRVYPVQIYGSAARALSDSCVIPNLISAELVEKLHLMPTATEDHHRSECW